MIVSLPSRGIGAAVLAAGLILAGCSSDSDVPPTEASAPGGGTQINTDTGSGGEFPDINTVPNQRPTSTFQELAMVPEGLPGAQSGTQYGEALVGGPTSTAAPPAPPPPPEPELAPIPEPGIQTEQTDAAPSETPDASVDAYTAPDDAPVASNEPIATPEIVEPQPMEPVTEPAPNAGQGQTIQGTTAQPAAEPEPAPVASAPEPQPQPQDDLASAPTEVPAASAEATQQAGLPASGAPAPEEYGITAPQPAPPASYGGAAAAPAAPAATPGFGQPQYTGQPVGLIYFRDGSSSLSDDDRGVLKEIADLQRAYGGIVNVIGHSSTASAEGTDQPQANQRISEERAIAVAQELMTYGVAQSSIRAAGVGASQPLYAEGTPGGAAANRRVEVYLSAY
jgi:outer membrane protein OmpA-like peptidoglycan-associated protein